MDKGVTVIKNAGQQVPDDYLAKAIEGQSCMGAALVHSNGAVLTVARRRQQMPLDGVKKFNEKFKDNEVGMYFQTGVVALDEDMQPFTLLANDDGQPLLVAFLEGNFSQFEQTESTHTPEYHAVEMELKPRIQKLFKMLGYDMKKLMEEIKDPMTTRDIGNTMVGERGSITFFPVGSDPHTVTVATDETQQTFPWGWVSDAMGYVEGGASTSAEDDIFADLEGDKSPTTPEVPHQPQQQASRPGRPGKPASVPEVRGNSGAPGTGPQPDIEPPKDRPDTKQPGQDTGKPAAVPGPQSKPDAAAGGSKEDPVLELMVPKGLKGDHKKMSKFLRKRIPGGLLPKDFMSLNSVKCRRSEATEAFLSDYNKQIVRENGLKAVAEAVENAAPATATAIPATAGATSSAKAAAPVDQPAQQAEARKPGSPHAKAAGPVERGYPEREKDVDTHHVGKTDTGGVLSAPIAMINPQMRKTIMDRLKEASFKQAVDHNSQLLKSDPAKVKEFEDKIPKIHESLGLKSIEDTMNWPVEEMLKWNKDDPNFGIQLSKSWLSEAMAWKGLAEHLQEELDQLKGTKRVEEQTQTEVPLKATGTDGATVRQPLVRDKQGETVSQARRPGGRPR